MRESGGDETWRAHLAQLWSRAAEAAALRDISQALLGRQTPSSSGALAEAVGAYRAAVDGLHRRDLTHSLPTDAVGRMFGVGFVLEQFQRDLGDLAERARERSAGREEA